MAARKCKNCDGFLWQPNFVSSDGLCPVCGEGTVLHVAAVPYSDARCRQHLQENGPPTIAAELPELDAQAAAEWARDWQLAEHEARRYGGRVGLADLLQEMAERRERR